MVTKRGKQASRKAAARKYGFLEVPCHEYDVRGTTSLIFAKVAPRLWVMAMTGPYPMFWYYAMYVSVQILFKESRIIYALRLQLQ
ncbi:MAG: hypothetical protein Q8K59_01975 [Nitrosomonas sp.]|nr:hypothetical protein [Nitrosomonas sp.]MDP1949864.1 hypothetical protein [Nitrosomonas sp.]